MKQTVFAALVAAAMVGLVTVGYAAEKAPADYEQAMKDLGAFAAGIDRAVEAEDFDTVTRLAVSARKAFEVTQTYWTEKSKDAAEQALSGYKSAADLEVVAGFKNKEGAVFSAGEVKASCGACHQAHRDKAPDGSFQIK